MNVYALVLVDYDWYTYRDLLFLTPSKEEIKEYLKHEGVAWPVHQMSWEDYENAVPYALNEEEIPHYLLIKKEITCPK